MTTTDPKQRVLVVEDEPALRRFEAQTLQQAGFEVHEAATLARALIDAGTRRPDLVLLDLGLPDGDGIDLIRHLRGWSAAPVIVVSARSDESDKVQALDAGADDYLAKPFGVAELLARVRAHLRRRSVAGPDNSTVITFGPITLDLARRSVARDAVRLHLTPIEYRLLSHLATHPHCVLTHRQLLQAVWGPHHGDDTHYLRVFMAQLRRKIEVDPAQPRHLLTETGIGYRFVP